MQLQSKQAEGEEVHETRVHGHERSLTISSAAFLRTWRPCTIMPTRTSAATATTPPTTPPTMAPVLVELPLLGVAAGAAGVVALAGGGDAAPVTVETDTDVTSASTL